jgi:hypothetical protein
LYTTGLTPAIPTASAFYTLDFSIDDMQLHQLQPDGGLDIFFFSVSEGDDGRITNPHHESTCGTA